MELCTSQAISHLPRSKSRRGFILSGNAVNLLRGRASFPIRRNTVSLGLRSRILRCKGSFTGETISEEASTGEKCDGAVAVEDVSPVEKSVTSELELAEDSSQAESSEDEQTQSIEFLDKLDSENTYPILLYGSGALVVLYLASAVIGSVESIPLLPKLLEVVGLGYTLWFTTRYVLFKKNRQELSAKIEEIKQQVLGSDSDR
ncbi:PREDICTED: protein CURVATURE THYLAKOID 1D, chloroplastic-like [Tarenaya hassleriana]|uniref:protein CURVATURE THYLAKOID 1D, chloroplastic-like n=1 Tax=Tarenaya hassleriana TaxID=28532 RepID=UPI00053C8F20|nr:PREDICTED: protein CURVATURE THYLAKOID 1D, chloroplastic-like [Tarenaya hassleriana]